MAGDGWIQQILLSGKYAYKSGRSGRYRRVDRSMADVTEQRKDHVRQPKRIELKMTPWEQQGLLRWTSCLVSNWGDVVVPVEHADDAALGYYNCRILRRGDVISVINRSFVTDFQYRDEYFDQYVVSILDGPRLEQHAFDHVHMPRDHRSGYLLIGKIGSSDQSLELTAFNVAPGDAVYIPAGTVHTNDFLLGAWKTLLSTAAQNPHALIKQPQDQSIRLTVEQER